MIINFPCWVYQDNVRDALQSCRIDSHALFFVLKLFDELKTLFCLIINYRQSKEWSQWTENAAQAKALIKDTA